NPNLPKYWSNISFGCTFRGVDYSFKVSTGKVTLKASDASTVIVSGKKTVLKPNEEITVSIDQQINFW
ncbi:MAG: hypothetical protein CVT98_08050, partial [Bacteroidetes bacterium HGW-Bacteroidetes-15]